jgi:hypothetical protein
MCGCLGPGMVGQPVIYPMKVTHAKYERMQHRWPGVMSLLKLAGIENFNFVDFCQFFVFFWILGGPYLPTKLYVDIETRVDLFSTN